MLWVTFILKAKVYPVSIHFNMESTPPTLGYVQRCLLSFHENLWLVFIVYSLDSLIVSLCQKYTRVEKADLWKMKTKHVFFYSHKDVKRWFMTIITGKNNLWRRSHSRISQLQFQSFPGILLLFWTNPFRTDRFTSAKSPVSLLVVAS